MLERKDTCSMYVRPNCAITLPMRPLLMMAGLSAPVPSLAAQTGHLNDTTHVIAAAAEYAYTRLEEITLGLPERDLAVDRRVLVVGGGGPPRREGQHGETLLVAVAQALSAKITDSRDAIRCGNGPRDCRLSGATVLLGLGVPRIGEDVARIPIEFAFQIAILPGEVVRNGWVVVVRREAAGWRAVGTERAWAT